jgi:hypothetical protein
MGYVEGYSSLSHRSPSVGPEAQDQMRLSDAAHAACQSDKHIAVISSLLQHVIGKRKDLGCGFRRLLVYFIIYFWFLELTGIPLSLAKDAIHEIGTGLHRMSLTSTEILSYLD